MANSFDNIGKKMPYTVPEGYLGNLQQKIIQNAAEENNNMRTLKAEKKKRNLWIYSCAACVAVLLIGTWMLVYGDIFGNKKFASYTHEEVEKCFSQLSTEDQDYILDIYSEDILLSEIY